MNYLVLILVSFLCSGLLKASDCNGKYELDYYIPLYNESSKHMYELGPLIPIKISKDKNNEHSGIAGYAIIDTGAPIVAIDESVAIKLRLTIEEKSKSFSFWGESEVNNYKGLLTLAPIGVLDNKQVLYGFNSHLMGVKDLSKKHPKVDNFPIIAVVGRSVLKYMNLSINGIQGKGRLNFSLKCFGLAEEK